MSKGLQNSKKKHSSNHETLFLQKPVKMVHYLADDQKDPFFPTFTEAFPLYEDERSQWLLGKPVGGVDVE